MPCNYDDLHRRLKSKISTVPSTCIFPIYKKYSYLSNIHLTYLTEYGEMINVSKS